MNDLGTVPTKVYRVMNELIRPYIKEEDWEDLEPRLWGRLDEIFSYASDQELRNKISSKHPVAQMENKILSNKTVMIVMTVNFVVMISLFIFLLFVRM